jgi:hypothetical protein
MSVQEGEWGSVTNSSGKQRVMVTSSQCIRILKSMIKWKLPLVYTIDSVQRDGDKIVIVLTVIAEGGKHE